MRDAFIAEDIEGRATLEFGNFKVMAEEPSRLDLIVVPCRVFYFLWLFRSLTCSIEVKMYMSEDILFPQRVMRRFSKNVTDVETQTLCLKFDRRKNSR